MNRRTFFKAGGAAVATGLISLGLQNAVVREDTIKYIPGAGSSLDKETLEEIDKDAFIALCSRCGVCAEVCPFKAIKFEGMAFPQLTDATRHKCPGLENCGFCSAHCPTDAIGEAFDAADIYSKADKISWWEKPKEPDI